MAKQYVAVDERPIVVFGVDPGKEVGISVYFAQKLITRTSQFADDATPWIVARLMEMNSLDHRIVIAVERYTFGVFATRKSRQNDAMKITGQLENAARNSNIEFTLVNQADSKRMFTNARLRQLGWFTAGMGDHVNDATRVALTALAQLDVAEFTRFLSRYDTIDS